MTNVFTLYLYVFHIILLVLRQAEESLIFLDAPFLLVSVNGMPIMIQCVINRLNIRSWIMLCKTKD